MENLLLLCKTAGKESSAIERLTPQLRSGVQPLMSAIMIRRCEPRVQISPAVPTHAPRIWACVLQVCGKRVKRKCNHTPKYLAPSVEFVYMLWCKPQMNERLRARRCVPQATHTAALRSDPASPPLLPATLQTPGRSPPTLQFPQSPPMPAQKPSSK